MDDLNNTNDLRYKLLDHFKNYKTPGFIKNQLIPVPKIKTKGTQPSRYESWFEVEVRNDIVAKGYSVIPQYEVAKGKYRIDLVTVLSDGQKIAIECDGDKWHGADQYQNDIMRQKVLERCGWQFFRVRGYEYYTNRVKALELLWKLLPEMNKNEEPEQPPIKNAKEEEFETNSNFIHKSNGNTHSTPSVSIQPGLFNGHDREETAHIEVSMPENDKNEVLRYFNLYKSGAYIMTVNQPIEADFVIPIKSNQKHGYLIQCYDTGHINKVLTSVLLSRRTDKEYKNGLNINATLQYLKLIESDKIIGLTFNESGVKKFKAHLTENISNREQLHLQGYKVMYGEYENIEFKILPIEILNGIERLVFQSFTSKGKPVDNNYYEKEWSILEQFMPVLKTRK